MNGDIETVTIKDESRGSEKRFQLYIDGHRRGLVTRQRCGRVQLHWETAGPCDLEEARSWVQGMLELSMITEQLAKEPKHGKKK